MPLFTHKKSAKSAKSVDKSSTNQGQVKATQRGAFLPRKGTHGRGLGEPFFCAFSVFRGQNFRAELTTEEF